MSVLLADGVRNQSDIVSSPSAAAPQTRVKAFPNDTDAILIKRSISPDRRYLAYWVRGTDPTRKVIFVIGSDGRGDVSFITRSGE